MTSSPLARRGVLAALTAIAAAAFFLIAFTADSARAATSGSVVISIPSGKAGKVSAIAPAKVEKRFGKKGAKISASATGGTFGDTYGSGLQAAGGIKLTNGKRSLQIRGLRLSVNKDLAVVRGNIAGAKNIVVFTAPGTGTFGTDPKSMKFSGGKLVFPGSVAKKVKNRLRLKKAPTGLLGSLNVKAALLDQYDAQCGVPVNSVVDTSWTDATALPTLSSPATISATGSLPWGFKSSFRGYVNGVMIGDGSDPARSAKAMQALDGAVETAPDSFGASFAFPVSGGEFAKNESADPADDQAVINTTGTALICNSTHMFWVSITDPTIVIDGANSRIVATISENINGGGMFGAAGPWETPQRVDLATLDLSAVTPTYGSGTVTWSAIPATLSATASPFATYPQGPGPVALDPVTVTVTTG